ncbi:MAG: helix-hairpin-helix domain-containing protein [Myxococcales bacterium]|nr:helix-hairpin-helix domain-containing protein [Myxococcales bacterium]
MGALLLFHWLSNTTPPTAPTPAHCARWTGLSFKQQQIVICLPQSKDDARRALALQLKRFARRCAYQHIPLPTQGQLLAIQQTTPTTRSTTQQAYHPKRPNPHTKQSTPCRITTGMLPAPQRLLLGIPLPLNHATPEELASIPRLSKRIAHRIVAYRKQHGAFSAFAQLRNIRGIGPKTLQRIQPHLSLK